MCFGDSYWKVFLICSLIPASYIFATTSSNRGSVFSLLHPGNTPKVTQHFSVPSDTPEDVLSTDVAAVIKQDGMEQAPPGLNPFQAQPAKRRAVPTDDEDLLEGSGDESEEGRGRSDLLDPPEIKDSKIWRIRLKLHMTWTPALNDSSTQIYKSASKDIQGWINSTFEEVRVGPIQFLDISTAHLSECIIDLELPSENYTKENIFAAFKSQAGIAPFKADVIQVHDPERPPTTKQQLWNRWYIIFLLCLTSTFILGTFAVAIFCIIKVKRNQAKSEQNVANVSMQWNPNM